MEVYFIGIGTVKEGEIDGNGDFEADLIETIEAAPFTKDVYLY